jgi:hypothetical protein
VRVSSGNRTTARERIVWPISTPRVSSMRGESAIPGRGYRSDALRTAKVSDRGRMAPVSADRRAARDRGLSRPGDGEAGQLGGEETGVDREAEGKAHCTHLSYCHARFESQRQGPRGCIAILPRSARQVVRPWTPSHSSRPANEKTIFARPPRAWESRLS